MQNIRSCILSRSWPNRYTDYVKGIKGINLYFSGLDVPAYYFPTMILAGKNLQLKTLLRIKDTGPPGEGKKLRSAISNFQRTFFGKSNFESLNVEY